MKLRTFASATVLALTLAATTVASVSPAAAWCNWRGCGWGYGYGGPVAAGVVAGTALGVVAATAAVPRAYYYAPGGYWTCPPGYHLGPYRRACWAN